MHWKVVRHYSKFVAPGILPNSNSPVRDLAEPARIRLHETDTVYQALSRLRTDASAERALYFYVTDSDGRLVGVAPARRLLLAEPSTFVGELMVHPVVSVNEADTFGQTIGLLVAHRLLALPVVNDVGRLTGVVDVSRFVGDLLKLERKQMAEQFYQLSGVRAPRRFSRAPVSIAAGLLAALLLSLAGAPRPAEVLCLIPLIMMFGETIAVQTVSLHLDNPQTLRRGRGAWRDLPRSLAFGSFAALVLGLLVAGWPRLSHLGGVAALALVTTSASGVLLGVVLPPLFRRLGLHTRLASGPTVAALTNLLSISGYLALSKLLVR